MASPHVSIKDIARAAGVSYSTVSRALNENPAISQEVRERVQTIAQEMGYTPNALAQSLHFRLTHSIGVVITTIADPFFADVVHGVEEIAQEADLSVFLSASNNDPEREMRIIETYARRRVDGIIVAASRIGEDYAGQLDEIRIPVIMVNNQAPDHYRNLCSISVDDYQGACLAVDHLIALGHTRIGYIGVSNRPSSNAHRLQGYTDTLEKHGIIPQSGWVGIGAATGYEDFKSDLQVGHELAPALIQNGVTGLFCYCDTVAIGALMACRKLGIPVPEAISIIGFDDNDMCEIVTPQLTTIHQPKRRMGQLAMKMLLSCMHGEIISDCILEPKLVRRASTASLQKT